MNCRLGTKDDIEAIVNLIHAAIEEMERHGIYQWDELYPTAEDFAEDIEKGNLFVAEEAGELVAIYVINKESDDEYKTADWHYSDETAYILHRFCVSPKFQGKSVGRQLLSEIESQVRNMGYESIRLDAFTENPFAQRLYRHNGYEARGFADWRKGRFDLMEKKL